MTETQKNTLEIVQNFDLDAFWKKHFEAHEDPTRKSIEFGGGVKTTLERGSQAAKHWGTGGQVNVLKIRFKRLPAEKTEALKIEAEKEFANMKSQALARADCLKNPSPILKKEVEDALETLHIGWLEQLAGGFMQDFTEYPKEVVQTLAQIQFVQWAAVEIEKIAGGIVSEEIQRAPKITWKRNDNALYFLFAKLKDEGLLEGTWQDIVRMLQMNFVGFDEKKPENILRMIQERSRPKSSVSDEIEHIVRQVDKQG